MGIFNKVASKILGMPSINELADRDIGAFLQGNGLSQDSLTMYKLDRCNSNPRFFERVYVGTAMKSGQLVGLVFFYNEYSGTLAGAIVNEQAARDHINYASKYRVDSFPVGDFYSFYIVEAGGAIQELVPLHELR